MATAAAPYTEPPHAAPRLVRVRGVETFAAGKHRDGSPPWTVADIDSAVRNVKLNRDIYQPPISIGHVEDSSAPKFGRVVGASARWRPCVTCRGSGRESGVPCGTCDGRGQQYVMSTDWDGVPEAFADAVRAGMYDRVSAEMWRQTQRGMRGSGPSLRCIAALGAEPPQVKTLVGDLTRARWESHAESRNECRTVIRPLTTIHHPDRGTYEIFSEVRTVPDVPEQKPEGTPPAAAPADHKQQLAEKYGVHPDHVAQMSDQMAEHLCSRFAEMGTPVAPKTPADAELKAAQAKEGPPKKDEDDKMKPEQFAEAVAKAVEKVLSGAAGATLKTLKDAGDQAKRQDAEKFCEQLRQDNRITAAQMDATGKVPTVLQLLLAADNTRPEKFSEAADAMTPYQALKAQLAALPAVGRGSKIGTNGEPLDEELAKVERFSEDPDFVHALATTDRTPADFVQRFKELKAKNPALTAVMYGVPQAV